MTAWILRACLVGALCLPAGCGSAEETPPPPKQEEHPLERGTSEELAPPLGKPRPKLVPGDVLEREAAAQSGQASGQETEEPADAQPERTD